ncbi:ester hydrolase C11orf54 homolog isoform X2 [Hyperolius riggenbachi]|uniref:ester hydrolase C11orf54 homolog isoform X2 n=1 Tax=Hyperolius riggenbachi TaxID=752182 RepID=UPI0035A2B115
MADTESCALHLPALEDIAAVLEGGLKKNYAEVQVKVVDCPDLTQEPFGFPVKGLCGKPRIADVGGVPYLVPTAQLDKIYNMNSVAKKIELPGAYILGAGASSSKSVGMNAEVIEVKAQKRTGKDNFVTCMRKSLKEHYGDKAVGMGGTFVIQEGKAKLHVMPREFSACPLNTDEDVDHWLNFYEMRAPLICQSVFVSQDPGFDLRVEHTHCFSHHGEGGHYHTDTTPDTVQYVGYFHPAEYLYRIDRPPATHMIGRD